MNPNTPSIPSPVESAFYYYGLPSEPALVAWSSVNLWVEPHGPEAYLVAKELQPVGPHDNLDGVWEPTVAPTIEAYLGNQQVAWTSLDPAHIGYAGGESFPVIIWIGVVPGSLVAEKGLEIALGCHAILTDNGISDVHVEIRQSKATLHAMLYKPVRTTKPTTQAIEPFATTLSLPICGADTTNMEGTGGFFFIDPQRPGKLYLITARHVLFHPDLTTNEAHMVRFSSQAAKKVFLLSDAALKERIEAIQSEISGKEILLRQLAAWMLEVEGQDDKDAYEEVTDVLHSEEEAQKAIAALNELLHDVTRDWDSPADRTIGHVVLSPRLGFSVGVDQYTKDWAVIEIDRTRIDNTNFIANCIDLGTSIPVDEFTSKMYPHPANLTSFKYPGNRLLKFFGTIPDSQMGGPDKKTLDHDNDPVIMVIKQGGASGLTIGRLNTIRSFVHFYFKGKPGQRTREVTVYPCNSKSGAFSEPGDSGSVVIDGMGRVAGILTGGTGATKSSDCTYVTSINFLIKHLQENGFKPNIFPTTADL